MKEFEALYELQKKNLIYSAWAKETSLLQRVQELKLEVDEALVEVKQKEWQKFKDEMGDVLWDCIGVIARAEHEGHLSMREVLEHIHEKFTARKPYLLTEQEVSREEERRIWKEVKEKQNGPN
jgi:NTP pyrophosphatase (non-canonical NTP hydrolase)